jgi:hypothetical protein
MAGTGGQQVVAELVMATDQLRASAAIVQGIFKDISRSAGTEFAKLPAATKPTEAAVNDLKQAFVNFKSEQVQQARQARFVANEIASLIPAAEGAKSQVAGLAAVLIEGATGGLTFGFALEAAKLVIGVVSDALDRANARIREHKAQLELIEKGYRDAASAWTDFIEGTGRKHQGAEQIQYETQRNKLLKEQAEALRNVQKAQGELDFLRAKAREAGPVQTFSYFGTGVNVPGQETGGWVGDALKKVREEEAKLTAAQQGLIANADPALRARAQAAVRFDVEEDIQKRLTDLAAKGADDRARIDIEYQQRIREIRLDVAGKKLSPDQGDRLAKAETSEYRNQIAALQVKRDLEANTLAFQREQLNAITEVAKLEAERNRALADYSARIAGAPGGATGREGTRLTEQMATEKQLWDDRVRNAQIEATFQAGMRAEEAMRLEIEEHAAAALARQAATLKDQKATMAEMVQAGHNLASIFGNLGSAIGGDMGKAFSTISTLIDGAVKLAAAWTAVSAGQGGPWAWLTIPAAIASTVAAIAAAHAKRGYDVGSESPITQLHPREMVLPAELAEKFRRLVEAGSTPKVIYMAPSKPPNMPMADDSGPQLSKLRKRLTDLATAHALGGFDIPAGMNPLTQLHAREMVLPPQLAERVRKMTEPTTGKVVNVYLNIQAMNGGDVYRTLTDHRSEVVRALQEAAADRRI